MAKTIAEGKNRSGMSWRQLARCSGVSHPHLVLLAQGKRVPSHGTAEKIIAALPLTQEQADALRATAVEVMGRAK